jgi:threonine dehydratase
MPVPERAAIEVAAGHLGVHVRRTPTLVLEPGALHTDAVELKLEHLQVTGTFKARGAFATLLASDADEVVLASGGNAGAAFAYAARALGRRAVVYVPTIVPDAKADRLRAYGADVRIVGDSYADAFEAAGAHPGPALHAHAYDRAEMLIGSGTMALEWEDQSPNLDTLLIAVGGGGLIGGVLAWHAGRTRVVAVETHGTPTLHAALEAGHPVPIEPTGIGASALGARQVGEHCWALREHLADSVLVSDDDVREATARLWDVTRLLVEPGGAVALAALTSGAYRPDDGERVGVLLCGANTDPATALVA